MRNRWDWYLMIIWAAAQNQQNVMWAQRRFRSAWASAQYDQSLHCALNRWLRVQCFFIRTAKTDQTGQMPRLIRVFARHTYRPYHLVGLVVLPLKVGAIWTVTLTIARDYLQHGILCKIQHAKYLSRNMTKPTKWVCAQQRLSSAWASAQSDQSLRCPHEESLGP